MMARVLYIKTVKLFAAVVCFAGQVCITSYLPFGQSNMYRSFDRKELNVKNLPKSS